jgi:hypothetical protein
MDISPVKQKLEPVSTQKSQTMSRLILQKAIESAQQNEKQDAGRSRTESLKQGKTTSLQPHLGQNIDIYV